MSLLFIKRMAPPRRVLLLMLLLLANFFLGGCKWGGSFDYNAPLPREVLDKLIVARQIFDARDYTEALRHYRRLYGNNEGNKAGEEALFQMAECHFHLKDYYEASLTYIRLLEDYTQSRYTTLVCRRILNEDMKAIDEKTGEPGSLGIYWLGWLEKGSVYHPGVRRPFLWLFEADGEDVGEDLLSLYNRRNHLSDLADDAQRILADYYFFQVQDYLKARMLYNQLVETTPDSEWVELSRYRVALCYYKSWSGIAYDFRLLDKAYERFSYYVREYPQGNWVVEAERLKQDCLEKLAQRALFDASHLVKQGNRREAIAALKKMQTEFPTSACIGDANILLEKLTREEHTP